MAKNIVRICGLESERGLGTAKVFRLFVVGDIGFAVRAVAAMYLHEKETPAILCDICCRKIVTEGAAVHSREPEIERG